MSATLVDTLREVAAAYRARPWPVIPVAGKKALVCWEPYQAHLPTPAELGHWPWTRATGVAIVLGPALWHSHPYLWIWEVEVQHRAHAEAWLDLELPHWRTSLVAESGRRGLHLICEASVPVSTTFYDWGEIRGRGSYTVLPPSRHPNGNRYRWLAEGEPIRWEPFDVPGAEQRERRRFDEKSGPIGEGQRNTTLFKLGCRLRAVGLAASEIAAALRAVNQNRCQPPLACDEVDVIAASCARYALRSPGSTLTTTGRIAPRIRTVRDA